MMIPDNYGYSGYDIGFDARSEFSLPDGSWGKNVIIFGADNNTNDITHLLYMLIIKRRIS